MAEPRRVLVTRPEPGASQTAGRLRRMGFEPVLAPLLEVCTLQPPLPPPGSVQAVLVTSGNAVPALPAAYQAVPLLTVGDATAKKAVAAGFAHVASADGDAEALAALAVTRLRPDAGPLLLAAGEGRGAALSASLSRRGYEVTVAEVYAARPVSTLPAPAIEAMRGLSLSAALFFSAETAHAFVRLAMPLQAALREVVAVAIGQSAAVPLGALPWRSIRIAQRPTQDEVLACLR